MTRDADDIKRELEGYYPHLSEDDIRRKINASDNAFLYFRAFVPWFHGRLRFMESGFSDAIRALFGFQGWCVGDPHLQNFGVIRSGRCDGRFTGLFTANDPDDGGPGPLAADVVRYLSGILIHLPDERLDLVIKAYLNGLIGGNRPEELADLEQSFFERIGNTEGEADKVDFDGSRFKLKDLDGNRFDTLNVKNKHRRQVKEAIAGAIGDQFKVCSRSLFRFRKKGGGSGGLIQFRVLLIPKGVACSKTNHRARQAVKVIDLKPITRPGICGWNSPVPPGWPGRSPAGGQVCGTEPGLMVQRVERTMELERSIDVHGWFPRTLVHPRLGSCLVRIRCNQEAGVSMDELNQDLMTLEADVLGRLHAKSLTAGQAGDLRHKFEVAKEDLVNLADDLARLVQSDFNTLRC